MDRGIEYDERVARRRRAPRRAGAVAVADEELELLRTEELEADVVRDPSAELRLRPQQPVGVAVVGEHRACPAGSRRDLSRLRLRPLADVPPGGPRGRVRGCRHDRRERKRSERADEAAEAPEVERADERIDEPG